jgi:hypothetical protein
LNAGLALAGSNIFGKSAEKKQNLNYSARGITRKGDCFIIHTFWNSAARHVLIFCCELFGGILEQSCAGLRLDQERLSRVTHLAVQVDLCLQQVADKPALGRIDSEYPAKPGYRQHRSNCLAYEMQPEAERHRNYSCSSQDLHGPKPQSFDVEFSDLDIAEKDPVEVFGHQLKA